MYTRYEVRFNREQFDSIVGNQWYIKSKLPKKESPGTFKDGSVEVKAAWRILKPEDAAAARARFYVTKAQVLDAVATQSTGSTVCNDQDVALVGFHIVIKTKLRPQWIWSSFEHVDNVPPKSDEPDAKNVPTPYSFNSGAPPQTLTTPIPGTITPANQPSPNPAPMQVIRKQPIQPITMERNRAYRALPGIKDTVWANYMLVMTQWPSAPGIPATNNMGGAFPTGTGSTLANTTMETYQQKPSSSCMECHQSVSNALGRDFVAFMAIDASEPVHQTVAAAAALGAPFPQLTAAANTKAAKKKAAQFSAAIKKTPLDEDPVIKALVKQLRQ
jgi:hypothetical protein